MGLPHGTPRILLGTSCRPADHLRHEVFEPRSGHAMMGFIHLRIGVKSWIVHDAVNKVIDDGSDGIHTSQPVIQGLCHSFSHGRPPRVRAKAWLLYRDGVRDYALVST